MKHASPSASSGRVQAVVVAGDAVTIDPHTGGVAGSRFSVRIIQDATGYAVTFDSAYVGACEIPTTPNTYSALQFEVDPSGKAYLCAAPVLGVPLP